MPEQEDKPEALPKRILVADDEHLMATGLTSSLRGLGFEVVGPVASGSAAVEIADEEPIDMALLDIRMPGMDGIEAAEVLWNKHSLPTVIITAYSDDQYLRKAQQTGVFGYLLKPASAENLRVAISVAWARALEQQDQTKRIGQLECTLANRRVIEQAKWQIIKALGIEESEAHARLQRIARDGRRRLADVASDVIAGRLVVS